MNNKNFPVILLAMVMVLLSSCGLERKLAKEFVTGTDSISVLIIPPDFIFKTNLKTWSIGDVQGLDETEKNRLLLDSSKFLKFVSDTLFINRYIGALESELSTFGIRIFHQDELTDFLSVKNMAYQVSLPQLELEEGIYEYRAEEIFDSTVYYEDFALDQVSVNSWFEITKLNDAQAVNNVLYASDYVSEGLEGRFTQNIFTGEIRFKYNIFPIESENIYTLAAVAGERYAGYIFDYIMNQYIYMNFPEDRQPATYLRYDPDANVFYPAGDDRFIFLDE